MELVTRRVTEANVEAASALVQRSFNEFVAASWEPHAREVFLADTLPSALGVTLGSAAYAAATFAGEEMVGFLLMRTPNVLGMLFVHPQWLRRGVGRALWGGTNTRRIWTPSSSNDRAQLLAIRAVLLPFHWVYPPLGGIRARRLSCHANGLLASGPGARR
jgi:GNAT superfamily N-acetyltransferase